ncbi:hypothetical protein ACPCXA_10235 [Lysinibacillus agricola]
MQRSGSVNRSVVQRNEGYAKAKRNVATASIFCTKAKRRYSVEPYILETKCK